MAFSEKSEVIIQTAEFAALQRICGAAEAVRDSILQANAHERRVAIFEALSAALRDYPSGAA